MLEIVHINICSLRNNVHEILNLLVTDDTHIPTISETLLDNAFDNTVVAIHGYNYIYRKDKCQCVVVYIQNDIPVKLREDLMLNTVEVIWLQVHLPHLKTIVVGSSYRPPSANSQ